MMSQKEKAADLLEQGDGTIPKESTDMSTLTQSPSTLPVQDRPILERSRAPFNSEEEAFAKAEGISRLEVRYILSKKPRPETFRTAEGNIFRNAGDLYIRTCRDGERRFTAYMHHDSVHHDFRYFDRVIADAMGGRMDGWRRYSFKNGDEGWLYDYPNYQCEGLTFKPASVIIEEKSEAKMLVGFGAEWGYPCEEPRCREKYHEPDEISHTLDTLEKRLSKRSSYEIEICKDIAEPGSDWYVNFIPSEDLYELTAEQIATLANDLQWMGLECSTTNAKARTLRRDPSATEELMERDQ